MNFFPANTGNLAQQKWARELKTLECEVFFLHAQRGVFRAETPPSWLQCSSGCQSHQTCPSVRVGKVRVQSQPFIIRGSHEWKSRCPIADRWGKQMVLNEVRGCKGSVGRFWCFFIYSRGFESLRLKSSPFKMHMWMRASTSYALDVLLLSQKADLPALLLLKDLMCCRCCIGKIPPSSIFSQPVNRYFSSHQHSWSMQRWQVAFIASAAL